MKRWERTFMLCRASPLEEKVECRLGRMGESEDSVEHVCPHSNHVLQTRSPPTNACLAMYKFALPKPWLPYQFCYTLNIDLFLSSAVVFQFLNHQVSSAALVLIDISRTMSMIMMRAVYICTVNRKPSWYRKHGDDDDDDDDDNNYDYAPAASASLLLDMASPSSSPSLSSQPSPPLQMQV